MAGELLSSKIVINEVEPSIPGLPVVQSAVLAAFGKAVRGVPNTPVQVTSFDEYVRTFGDFAAGFELPLAMRGYFLNGGRNAWVVRAGSGGTAASIVAPDVTPATTLTFTATSVGTWANSVKVYIKTATSGTVAEFNLEIELNGFIVERFSNVTNASTTAANYVGTIVNNVTTGSLYVTVASSLTTRPVNNTSGLPLASGVDPTVTDTELATAMATYNTIDQITIMICPDGSTTTHRNAMTTYAELTRNRQVFCIFDPPASTTAAGMVTDVGTLTASEQWAIYWPRVKVPNPSARIYGSATATPTITQCFSGFEAGRMARNDAEKTVGPFANPAGIEDGIISGVVGLETTEVLDEAKRDLVFPVRVNPVINTVSVGFYADGARTGLGTSNFPSVGERRGVSTIERQMKLALLFAKNKPNTPELRDRVYRTLVSIIMPYVSAGALASNDPAKAFFVDVSDQINTPAIIAAGKLIARVGLATARPAEFIIVTISQDTRALMQSLLTP